MKIETLKAVAEKYRLAIKTGEIPEQLLLGLCYALDKEVKRSIIDYSTYDWVEKIGYNLPTNFYQYLNNKCTLEQHLIPRLKWLEEQIERMENESL